MKLRTISRLTGAIRAVRAAARSEPSPYSVAIPFPPCDWMAWSTALMLASVGYATAYAGKGVRVNVINPGMTRTGRVQEGLEASSRATGKSKDELLAAQVEEIPLGRIAEPEEIANVALFLASPLASYVTGAVIPMDGGKTGAI